MARRSGLERFLMASAKEISRQTRISAQEANRRERQHIVATQRAIREQQAQEVRFFKEQERAKKQAATDAKRLLSHQSQSQADELNRDIAERLKQLAKILSNTLHSTQKLEFNSLRVTGRYETPTPPQELLVPKPKPDTSEFYWYVKAPSGIAKIFRSKRLQYERDLAVAQHKEQTVLNQWRVHEDERLSSLEQWRTDQEQAAAHFEEKKRLRDAEVDAFELDYNEGLPDAIVAYFSMVLEHSAYPVDFPQSFSIAYKPESLMLVVDYQLPNVDVVPTAAEYRYVRTKNRIEEKPRKSTEIKSIYQDIISSVILRTISEIFEADMAGHISVACINGHVNAIDPATGRDIRPCLISTRVTREVFSEIDLSRVDKSVCLRNLGSQVSRNPTEVQAVKPIVEFEMADARFIDQNDLVSELGSAQNLMDLNPYEFENLVANLFGQMGLEAKLTRSTKDGGVDCIAFDHRPVLGGKVVIQAKRYRHTVGVSAVRDLYGTMLNEGANKGLLVATSGYGPDAFNFAKDKPIELIDGGGLLYLLEQIGIEARIVMPVEGA